MKQAEQLRDAVLSEHTRLKQAERDAEQWARQFRQLQAQLQEQTQAVLQLKQDKQMSQENANRYSVGCDSLNSVLVIKCTVADAGLGVRWCV